MNPFYRMFLFCMLVWRDDTDNTGEKKISQNPDYIWSYRIYFHELHKYLFLFTTWIWQGSKNSNKDYNLLMISKFAEKTSSLTAIRERSVLHSTYLPNGFSYSLPKYLNMIWGYLIVEVKFVQGQIIWMQCPSKLKHYLKPCSTKFSR